MITSQSQPKAFVPGVLKMETLMLINGCQQINSLGFSILDRWMLAEPARMRELEKNPVFLKILIRTQQAKEQQVLDSPEALEQMSRGLTAHEILTLNGVETTLDSAIAESGAIM